MEIKIATVGTVIKLLNLSHTIAIISSTVIWKVTISKIKKGKKTSKRREMSRDCSCFVGRPKNVSTMRRPLWKRRERVTLFKPLEMRTSADRDESYPRIRRRVSYRDEGIGARARGPSIYACGRFLPLDGSLFRALHARMCTRTHARPHPRAKKMCTRLGWARVCVYIASLECVPAVWIRRPPEIGCCEKRKRLAAPISFCSRLYRSDWESRITPYSCIDDILRNYHVSYDISSISLDFLSRNWLDDDLIDNWELDESLKFQSFRNIDFLLMILWNSGIALFGIFIQGHGPALKNRKLFRWKRRVFNISSEEK